MEYAKFAFMKQSRGEGGVRQVFLVFIKLELEPDRLHVTIVQCSTVEYSTVQYKRKLQDRVAFGFPPATR